MEEKIFSLLRNIIKNMRKVLDKEISCYAVGHSEMRILLILYAIGNCKQEELVSKIEVDRSNVGRSLKKLEQQGYITREKNTNDTRSFLVALTQKGLDIKSDLFKIKNNLEKTISSNITLEEMQILLKLLSTLNSNMTEKNYENIKQKG